MPHERFRLFAVSPRCRITIAKRTCKGHGSSSFAGKGQWLSCTKMWWVGNGQHLLQQERFHTAFYADDLTLSFIVVLNGPNVVSGAVVGASDMADRSDIGLQTCIDLVRH